MDENTEQNPPTHIIIYHARTLSNREEGNGEEAPRIHPEGPGSGALLACRRAWRLSCLQEPEAHRQVWMPAATQQLISTEGRIIPRSYTAARIYMRAACHILHEAYHHPRLRRLGTCLGDAAILVHSSQSTSLPGPCLSPCAMVPARSGCAQLLPIASRRTARSPSPRLVTLTQLQHAMSPNLWLFEVLQQRLLQRAAARRPQQRRAQA